MGLKTLIGWWLGTFALGALATEAGAQPYPAQKITLVVAFAPGGVADAVARLIGQELSERLRQTAVVEALGIILK